MKRLLLILILTFSFQSWAKANDIRDFEIEGMSIGDSVLDYYKREDLNKFYKINYPNSDKYIGYEIPNHLSKIKFKNYFKQY